MIVSLRGLVLLLLTGLGLAACDTLPRGAAVEREIVEATEGETADFAVYAVDRSFLPALADWPYTGERVLGWIPASGGARTQVIAAGDELGVTIWDSNESSLLSPEGQRAVEIDSLLVSPDGTIFVPYVGNTRVAGMTLQVAREHLQDEIDMVVPSAQVQLRLVEGRTNSVDLVGGSERPAPTRCRIGTTRSSISSPKVAGCRPVSSIRRSGCCAAEMSMAPRWRNCSTTRATTRFSSGAIR